MSCSRCFAENDDQRAGEKVCNQPDDICCIGYLKLAARLNEQIVTPKVANQRNRDCHPITAQPHRGRHGCEERNQRQRIAQEWIEDPTQ